ncbi:MAG TPA: hydroxyisourate hydrolase [Longimicrobium sp.]|nr:hydroxyisourate hydrolase [Longimicrobium sp.]
MSGITTHVLDTARGRPAGGIHVTLERVHDARASPVGRGFTDADGRLRTLVPEGREIERGTYRLTFDTGSYFRGQGLGSFYPSVSILFEITDTGQHYHVPLLLSPFGYSTYRGS